MRLTFPAEQRCLSAVKGAMLPRLPHCSNICLPDALMYHINLLQATDLPALMAIQAACYRPELNEPAKVMAQRLAQFSGWCWALRGPDGLAAYLLSLPARRGQITALGADFVSTETADCLYLHDLAVAPEHAGQGLGRLLVEHASQAARQHGCSGLALVCVQAALPFWQQLGFEASALDSASTRKLASYPGGARYLTRA